jgi:hypothetical protein
MNASLEYAQSPHTTPLYSEIFFNQNRKFQYPPSSLLAIAAMLKLSGPEYVRTTEKQVFETITFNDVLGWAFILISAVATVLLLEIGLRRNRPANDSQVLLATRLAIVTGLTLTFYPIVKAYTLGQIQVWINGLFALALLCWVTGYKASSGLLIGLMCLVKPHYGLFVLWAALRREWRFMAGCAATVAAGLTASVAAFGWANHIDYIYVVSYLTQHGETFYPNQSVNGILNRLMSLSDPVSYNSLEFFDLKFPPFNPWVYSGTLITSLIILSIALFRRDIPGDSDRTFDYCIMTLSATMASPIAWEHHYGIVLPIFAVLLTNALRNPKTLLWLAASYVLVSTFIPATNLLALTPLNFVQSSLFAGALIVLVLLHLGPAGGRTVSAIARP